MTRMLNAHWWKHGCFCCTRVVKRSSGIWRARENHKLELEFAAWDVESEEWAAACVPVVRDWWDHDDNFYSNTDWPDPAIWRTPEKPL